MKQKSRKGLYFAEYTGLLIFLVLIWEFASVKGYLNPLTLPSPVVIVKTFISLIQDGSLIRNLVISTKRVLIGYFISSVIAIIAGITIGLSSHFKRITYLLIQILKPIPPISWIPLVILWFGIGEESKIFLIFIGGFFTILVNVADGVRRVDPKLVELSKAMVIPQKQFVFQVVIPYAAPNIFTGLRVGLGQSWMCVVAAELVASSTGLGYMIMYARQFGQTNVVIVGMLMIGIIGKLFDSLLLSIEKHVVRWE
ncbi:MAG: ABC transporter permease [Lachnospiraceae bacterium]|nr:ABC transporter permease [Lachnospiraceae bacterium]